MSTVLDFGCDWITITRKMTADGCLESLYSQMSMGGEEWGMQGYRGQKCPVTNVRYGTRPDKSDGSVDEMFIASGDNAKPIFSFLTEPGKVGITRMDLQVTVRVDTRKDLARDWHKKLREMKETGNSALAKKKLVFITSDTGSTLYVGSRKSRGIFLRLYSKGAGCWRYEVQLGRKLAFSAYSALLGSYDTEEAVMNVVASKFKEFGMIDDLIDLIGKDVHLEPVPIETTVEKRLKWLAKCVYPVVRKLIYIGYEDDVRVILGLKSKKNM